MKQDLINYARSLNAKQNVIEFIKKEMKQENEISEWKNIINYLVYKDFKNLENFASYKLLKEKAKKWMNLLKQNDKTMDEEYGKDIEIVLDFEDGFKFVKLLSENAYIREGKLMKHCLASQFYRKNTEIFSLRDSSNLPHCTIEKYDQIKGKRNGDVSPKYIDYVVRFLELIGMDDHGLKMKLYKEK